jgi:hypothetical protein
MILAGQDRVVQHVFAGRLQDIGATGGVGCRGQRQTL